MSLRDFLRSNETKVVPYPCSVDYEIAAHIKRVCNTDGPILVFDDPKFPNCSIVGGVYGSKDRIMGIFDYSTNFFDCVKTFSEANSHAMETSGMFQSFLVPIHPHNAPVLENTVEDDLLHPLGGIDLTKLPICTHNEKDNGKFITAGVNVVKWIDGATMGLGIHRMNVINKNHLSCLAPPNRRIGLPYYKASENNKSIKMAVIIGAPPEVVLASQSKIPSNYDKYAVASYLNGEPLRMVYLPFSELWVPSEAEMVLECESLPGTFHNDTPFAEYPGTYSTRTNAWVLRVVKIHHRNDYLYQTILTGRLPQEDSNLCAIPYAVDIYDIASKNIEVTDISVFLGNNVFDTVVCVKKTSNEQIQNLMYSLLGNKYLKSVTIMDDDLQANEEDIRFAMNTRMQPNRDILITNLALGASLDPSSPLFQSTSKIAYDCTIPIGKTDDETCFNKFRHIRAKTKECDIKETLWENWCGAK